MCGRKQAESELLHVGRVHHQFLVGDPIANAVHLVEHVAAEHGQLRPRHGTVADEVDALRRHVGQQADGDATGNVEPVAEGPGNVDLLDVGEGEPDRSHQGVGGGVDRALGADQVLDVGLA